MTSTNQAHIDQLAANIAKWKDAYYNGPSPLVSDAVFDAAEDELRRLDPNHPVLKAIGAPVASGPLVGGGWPKVKHTIPMTSLNKAQVEADMDVFFKSCGKVSQFIVMDKLDGLSVSLKYENRKLVQACTRGDGEIGEDITRNVLLMKGAVKMLPPTMGGNPTPATVYVRGEMVVTHDDFKAHFPGESNPRNTASGTAKRQSDPAKCAYVTVIAYDLMPNGVSMSSKMAELTILDDMGFRTPRWFLCGTTAQVYAVYADYIATTRKIVGYDIDGLVIAVEDTVIREALGDLNGRPKGAIAYKFPHEEKTSILRDIVWQVGNSGRITPVAVFDPVVIAGAKVERASLATVRQVEMLKLFPGCRILVARRNDVIPRIEANLDEGVHND